jgi:hypothetical protein
MTEEISSFSSDRRSLNSTYSVKQAVLESDLPTLKAFVQNLKSNVSLNKELVFSLLSSKQSESFEDTTTSVMSGKALETLIQENRILEEKIEKIIEERNEFQSKALLNEQIKNEWALMHEELEDDFKEQIAELKMQNERKDKVITEIKQINSVLKLEADLANKSKHIFEVKPKKEIMEMHCQVEELRENIEDKARDIFMLESQLTSLKSFLKDTHKNILKIKALLANPVNRKNNLEKKVKNEFFEQIKNVYFEENDFSVDEKFRSFSMDEGNSDESDILKYQGELKEKSQKLIEISGRNLKIYKENQKLLKDNEDVANKVNKMYNEYYKEDMTTEIKNEYESSFCYKIEALSLDSIVEIEVNHSHFYESGSDEEVSHGNVI